LYKEKVQALLVLQIGIILQKSTLPEVTALQRKKTSNWHIIASIYSVSNDEVYETDVAENGNERRTNTRSISLGFYYIHDPDLSNILGR
jgi:hypothetical protein